METVLFTIRLQRGLFRVMQKIRAVFGAMVIHLPRRWRQGNASRRGKAFKALESWEVFLRVGTGHRSAQHTQHSLLTSICGSSRTSEGVV